MMDSTSFSLLQRLKHSQSDSDWNRFVRLYAPMIFLWCRSRGLSRDDSADIVQEVLSKLVLKLREFNYRPDQSFRAWLRTVTVNQAKDFQLRASNRAGVGLSAIPEPRNPSDAIDLFDHREYCRFLVARGRELIRHEFTPQTWDAFWKYAAEGRSAADVAAELGISANAVRVAKCRVLGRLRQELDGLLE